MNELVIFNYSSIRALNSSFKCYELAVRERAKTHVLPPSRGANGMISNGHVILSPTRPSHSSNLKTCPSPCIPCITALYSRCIAIINPWHPHTEIHPYSHSVCRLAVRRSPPPCLYRTEIRPLGIERYLVWKL